MASLRYGTDNAPSAEWQAALDEQDRPSALRGGWETGRIGTDRNALGIDESAARAPGGEPGSRCVALQVLLAGAGLGTVEQRLAEAGGGFAGSQGTAPHGRADLASVLGVLVGRFLGLREAVALAQVLSRFLEDVELGDRVLFVACTLEQLSSQNAHQVSIQPTRPFPLAMSLPAVKPTSARLRIYLEGDGHAWATPSQPSLDPSPRTLLMATAGCA